MMRQTAEVLIRLDQLRMKRTKRFASLLFLTIAIKISSLMSFIHFRFDLTYVYDQVEVARTAAINQEIKKILTEVLLKVSIV